MNGLIYLRAQKVSTNVFKIAVKKDIDGRIVHDDTLRFVLAEEEALWQAVKRAVSTIAGKYPRHPHIGYINGDGERWADVGETSIQELLESELS